MSPNDPPDESASALSITTLLNGTFVRIDQSWSFQGSAQEGSILIGCDEAGLRATAHWIDTFHNGRRVMACEGTVGDDGHINVTGSYPTSDGPDWAWRIEIIVNDASRLEIRMFNISPTGNAELAVESFFAPA